MLCSTVLNFLDTLWTQFPRCMLSTCDLTLSIGPFQLHLVFDILANGHFCLSHKYSSARSLSRLPVTSFVLPIWKFLNEYSFSAARLSRERLRTFRNGPLQIGHLSRVILQVQQRLCPLLQSMMGGAMYSMQTGHSNSCRSRRWRSSVLALFISVYGLAHTHVWNL